MRAHANYEDGGRGLSSYLVVVVVVAGEAAMNRVNVFTQGVSGAHALHLMVGVLCLPECSCWYFVCFAL